MRFRARVMTWLTVALAASVAPAAEAADPADHKDYTRRGRWTTTACDVDFRAHWPYAGSDPWNGAPADMPVAVILPGAGYSHLHYQYLQDHLAYNGILSVSVRLLANRCPGPNCATDHEAVAQQVEALLTGSCFRSQFLDLLPPSSVSFQRTAVIGHSRGGESARYVAHRLSASSAFGAPAVVALAPTRHTSKALDGRHAKAFMVLAGTADIDVGAGPPFATHDTTGAQDDQTPSPRSLERSMKLLLGGTHECFSDDWCFTGSTQWPAARGYVGAFLRGWLRSDWSFYGAYVRGDAVPGATMAVYGQFSARSGRRVVDNFQDGVVGSNALGGAVWQGRMRSIEVVDAGTLSSTHHRGWVLDAQPDEAGAWIGFDLPTGSRNLSGYRYLSLRIGRRSGTGAAKVVLRIRNGNTYRSVDLRDYAPAPSGNEAVPQPLAMCSGGAGDQNGTQCSAWITRGHMRTIRVPLGGLGLGGLTDVRSVYLFFEDATVGDRFLIDNLEFTDPPTIVLGAPAPDRGVDFGRPGW